MDNLSQQNPEILRVAFIKAGWHADIVGQCYQSCLNYIKQQSNGCCHVDAFDVPGALEIPLLAQDLANSGQYHAIIASALIVDGGIYRHDFVSSAVIDGIMRVQLDTGIPVFSAVLTPHHFHESKDHKEFFYDHFKVKGQEVAEACLMMIAIRRQISLAA